MVFFAAPQAVALFAFAGVGWFILLPIWEEWKSTCVVEIPVLSLGEKSQIYFCNAMDAGGPFWLVYWLCLMFPFGLFKLNPSQHQQQHALMSCALLVVGIVTAQLLLPMKGYVLMLLLIASTLSLNITIGICMSCFYMEYDLVVCLALMFVANLCPDRRLIYTALLPLSLVSSLHLPQMWVLNRNFSVLFTLQVACLIRMYPTTTSVVIRPWLQHFLDVYCFLWVRPSFANLNLLLDTNTSAQIPLLSSCRNGWHLMYLVLVKHQPRNFSLCMLHGWLYLILMSFVDPIVMHKLLSSESGKTPLRHDLVLALILSTSMLVRVSCMEVCFFYSVKTMCRSRSILQFNLLHNLFSTRDNDNNTLLPTLVSSDAERFGSSSWVIFFLSSWTFAIVSLPFTMWMLTYLVGFGGALVATGVMILGGFVTREIAKCSKREFELLNLSRDSRSQALLRCLNTMLQIKMFANESTWEHKLAQLREEEISVWWRIRLACGWSNACSALGQVSVSISVFAYVTLVDGKQLNAASAFATLLVLSQLSWSVGTLPDIFNLYSSFMPCANRLVKQLNQTASCYSTATALRDGLLLVDLPSGYAVGFDRVLFTLPPKQGLRIKRGELVLVTGPVGCGKSCLLRRIAETEFTCSKRMYLGQIPFLFNGTVRENVCMKTDCTANDDEKRFQRAVALAQLERDLLMLPQGANTAVGDGGVQLSGGQRARLALARAMYFASETDLYIVDDLFASVDSATGSRILLECVCDTLLRQGKSVLLASSYATAELIAKCTLRIDIHGSSCSITTISSDCLAQAAVPTSSCSPIDAVVQVKPEPEEDDDTEEEIQRGILYQDFVEYWSRFSIFPGSKWFLLVLVLTQAFLEFASPYWLAHWTSHTTKHGLEIYALIQLLFVCFGQVIYQLTTVLALSASNALHRTCLQALFKSPMSLFDSTSHGRIAQVLLGDLRNLDESLPDSGISQIKRFAVAVFQVCTITLIAPVVLFILPVLFFVYRWILQTIRLPSLGVKRMEAQSHGPVLASFLDAMRGKFVLTQSHNLAQYYSVLFEQRITRAEQTRVGSEAVSKFAQALAVQSGCLLFLSVSVAGVFALHDGDISDAKLGLILTFAGMLQRTGMDLMMGWTSFETNLVSIERVAKLMRTPSEEENRLPIVATTREEQASGVAIEFDNVTLRYRVDRPLVLQGVSFCIDAGSKVCIVGRTGEGKSSLFLALLRLYAIESGTIRINEQDARDIPLDLLRKQMCRVILQDCKLTERTLRDNLVLNYSQKKATVVADMELCSVLQRVGFQAISNNGLDALVLGENGDDLLSAGERQLVCIARALLGNPAKVLICDECTSFISEGLDDKVHNELLGMKHTTVLAIVHRPTQISKFDYQLVIQAGKVVEYRKLK